MPLVMLPLWCRRGIMGIWIRRGEQDQIQSGEAVMAKLAKQVHIVVRVYGRCYIVCYVVHHAFQLHTPLLKWAKTSSRMLERGRQAPS